MKRLVLGYLCILGFFYLSCLPKQGVLERHPPASRNTSLSRSSTAEAYIERFKNISIREMEIYGIPASITLAQALLESGSGNSYLARVANNHFGIKCASGWKGKTVFRNDDYQNECFRKYESPEASFRDHSEFLLRTRYASLFELDKNDYRGWAKGLKKAGYATNPRYAELLINLIERYELYRYDTPESFIQKTNREKKVIHEIEEKAPKEEIAAEAKPPVKMTIHEVREGEALNSIANRYGLTAEQLRKINGLNDNQLSPGQLLLVSK